MYPLLTLIFLIAELALIVLIFVQLIYITALYLSRLYEVPYVSTKMAHIRNLATQLALSPADTWLEIGCGDGRVVCYVVNQYKLRGTGVDVNPLMIGFARFRAWRMGIANKVTFIKGTIAAVELSQFSVIYLFMMPSYLERPEIANALIARSSHGPVTIISHWYQLPYLLTHLQETVITLASEKTYVYTNKV